MSTSSSFSEKPSHIGVGGIPFRVEISKQYNVFFEREAMIALNETNTYETELPPGLYNIVATSNNTNIPYRLRYDMGSYRDDVSDITANKPFKSIPLTVRSSEKNAPLHLELTGLNARLVTFNVKVLQSIGVQSIKKVEDDEARVEMDAFKKMMDEALTKKDTEQLKLVSQIAQSKGYTNLLRFGQNALQFLDKIEKIREMVHNVVKDQSTTTNSAGKSDKQRKRAIEHMRELLEKIVHLEEQSDSFTSIDLKEEEHQLKQLVNDRTQEQEQLDSLQCDIEKGDIYILRKRVTQAQEFIDSTRERLGNLQQLEKLKERAKALVEQQEHVNALQHQIRVAVLNKSKQGLDQIMGQLQKVPREMMKKDSSLQQDIDKAKQVLEEIEASENTIRALKEVVLARDTAQIGYFLDMNVESIPQELFSKASHILEALVQGDEPDDDDMRAFIDTDDEKDDSSNASLTAEEMDIADILAEESDDDFDNLAADQPGVDVLTLIGEVDNDGIDTEGSMSGKALRQEEITTKTSLKKEATIDDILSKVHVDSDDDDGYDDDGYEEMAVVVAGDSLNETEIRPPRRKGSVTVVKADAPLTALSTTTSKKLVKRLLRKSSISANEQTRSDSPADKEPLPNLNDTESSTAISADNILDLYDDGAQESDEVDHLKENELEQILAEGNVDEKTSTSDMTQEEKDAEIEIEPISAPIESIPQTVQRLKSVLKTPTSPRSENAKQVRFSDGTIPGNRRLKSPEELKIEAIHKQSKLFLERKFKSSHVLIDKLHTLIRQMIIVSKDNIVTRKTSYSLNVVSCIEDILTFRTKVS